MAALTEADVVRLEAEAEADPVEGFVAMWRTLEPDWDALDVVDPKAYTLPVDQTARLVAAGKRGCAAHDVDSWVTISLWLNKGPTTEVPE